MIKTKPLIDKNIQFLKRSHKYKYKQPKKKPQTLTSVTTLLKKYYPFDARAKARELAKYPYNKAQKRGVYYWLARWREAAEYGTKVHEEIELYVINKEKNPPSDVRAVNACKYYDELAGRFELEKFKVYPELKIADPVNGIAGTIDLVLCFEDKVLIYDWKTNGSMAHSLEKYNDQLRIYSYILEKTYGYQVLGSRIVHLQEDGIKEYVVKRDNERVEKLLGDYKQ